MLRLENAVGCVRNPQGIVVGVDREQLRVDVLRPDVLRLKISQAGGFDESPTFAACWKQGPVVSFQLHETQEAWELTTECLRLRIAKNPFSLDAYRPDGSAIFETYHDADGTPLAFSYCNDQFLIRRRCGPGDCFYGLGEKSGSMNHLGRDLIQYNLDIYSGQGFANYGLHEADTSVQPKDHTFDPYYINIPFFYHLPADGSPQAAGGFFLDNGYKAYYEFSASDHYAIQFCGGQYTEYVFAGPRLKDVLSAYSWVTGRMAAPPIWALGYHQCRWHPYSQETFLALADNLRKRQIPCDVLWLDIDYMDGFRVFTWDRKKYPDHEGMIRRLNEAGFRVISIVDPGVKYEPGYEVYDEGVKNDFFCKTESNSVYLNRVWPGWSAFPDFVKPEVRSWWGRLNAAHIRSGLDGIWNDMNEPAIWVPDLHGMRFDRNGKNFSHERYHNQYGMLMAMGTQEGLESELQDRRHFILSRAGFAGIQRYAANWLGDNCSRWDHLRMGVSMALGLGLSGQPFVGADVGGFIDIPTPELMIRWMQYGALTPFFRNHNAAGMPDQYPWSFGMGVEELMIEAIRLRYRLMPYVYSSFMLSCETGAPVQRPLVYDFQDDKNVWAIEDAYLLGESLLVAPVLQAGQTSRFVYLPRGTWVHWHTGQTHKGGGYVTVETPMDHIPLFARGGHVIPVWPSVPQSTMRYSPETVELNVIVPEEEGEFVSQMHEDDGLTRAHQKGAYLRTRFALSRKGRAIRIAASVTGNGFAEFRRKRVRVIFRNLAQGSLTLNGKPAALNQGICEFANAGKDFELVLMV